ncbi:arylsulfatase I-like [Acanthaster planci]|uniref:Arylsulfatase I-like n=1 Tax=Acanthaster planci TaxID=133434 RepID=A0A8B7XUJ0_ACAPL|nr:arylsulfatase I-like [Acanthaster planci]XP_022083580.1 arylsulfatase I-like [Acanthaster planci]XP_022083581.1 arylsulfatase I-like [Acanthaster planci]XP_022083582.1 arylsulfatase I-like [Acanthaster planci]XP_022083583.1 arylsulfatase I-like [Acanthaster planci]XP_022083584.1 arylsulfatase I-like [Acanthaster planci]
MTFLGIITSLLLIINVCFAQPAHPHIILIVADDLGWDDVSFHGSTEIPTPNIDKLARDGVILHNYYVMPLCTPTRSALMTGRHPIHLGLQHNTIGGAQPYGLGLNETLISQLLKTQGYKTHIVGKWHLGMFAKEYLPLNRGFDSHFGFLLGHEDYLDHTAEDGPLYWGYDFQRNSQIYKPIFGQYGTEILTEEVKKVITSHDPSEPLFLYIAQQAVHAGNSDHPLQAPDHYVQRFPNIKNEKRRIFAGMVSALDDSIGNITKYLAETDLYKHSIIIFTTDNGGAGHGYDGSVGCNWPLRGMKSTPWEGGVRGVGFVNSPLLEKPKRISHDLIHVSDWFPTMYRVAGGNVSLLGGNIYGKDVWDTVSQGQSSPRNEILLNIDPIGMYAALRVGDYKLLIGDNDHGIWDGWYPPLGASTENKHEEEQSLGVSRPQSALPPVVSCLLPRPSNASTNCKPFEKPCLFNIRNDPCEFYNIADWNQDILAEMMTRLHLINATAVPPKNVPNDPKGNPKLHGGNWVPWVNLTEYKL